MALIKITFNTTQELADRLDKMATREGLPKRFVLERALKHYWDAADPLKRGRAGAAPVAGVAASAQPRSRGRPTKLDKILDAPLEHPVAIIGGKGYYWSDRIVVGGSGIEWDVESARGGLTHMTTREVDGSRRGTFELESGYYPQGCVYVDIGSGDDSVVAPARKPSEFEADQAFVADAIASDEAELCWSKRQARELLDAAQEGDSDG